MQTHMITVSGKVQGVFFRQGTQRTAVKLGLTGTVRNLEDGRVQIIASGTEEQLAALLKWCETGPPRAQVAAVEKEAIPAEIAKGFTILK